ncbi:MAG: hypothetical protein KAG94_01795 [Clostridiales bacterium]|nr:hypothetical protein [Clostridiales bacterium]
MEKIDVIIKIIPLVITIVIGYFLYKRNIISDGVIDFLKKLVVTITLPASLLLSFIQIKFQTVYVLIVIVIFVVCLLLLFIGKLIARIFHIKSPYFPYLLTGFEVGMIGFALFSGIYGTEAISSLGIIDIGHELFIFIVLVPSIMLSTAKKTNKSKAVQSLTLASKAPVVWAIIVGVSLSIAGIYKLEGSMIYTTIIDSLRFISTPTAFIICLVIGSGLKLSLKGMKLEVITAFVKVAIALVFAILLSKLLLAPLKLDNLDIALYSMFVLPAPFVITVFMDRSNKDEVNYVSNTLSIGTIIGVILFLVISLL